MLEDDEMSEDYDNDPYFQDFDEHSRWLTLGGSNPLEEDKQGAQEDIEEANRYGLNLDGGSGANE
jgi:hypothetical protein